MLEGKNKFIIKNVAKGRMILSSLLLEDGETFEVNPILLTDATKKEIEYFIATGQIEVSIADVKESKEAKKEISDTVVKETTKNDKGETRSHIVYDPETASKNRAIAVESIEVGKAIETDDNKIDLVNFLEKHWKTIEREITNISNIARLEKLLLVADELGMKGNKKYELIKNRIKELN
jgi:hypothetical protein